MRPAFIDDMSWEMAEVYGAITDQILINLARHFPYFKPENLPGSAFAYQADMLAQMGQVNRETVRIIRNGLKNADDALQGCLEQAIIDSIKSVNPALYKAAKAGILKMPTSIVTAPNQMRAFQLYYQQAAQKLNMVNTVMLESTKQAYQATVADIVNRVQATQTALDIGAGEVVTGVSSWNQAMVHSINRLKANGITGFIDHGGHRWSAEAYTAMDIRTTMANTARAAVWETNQNFGNDLYSVSYHDGARPLCYPWQNKVISTLDRSGVTYDLDGNEIEITPQKITSYGEPAGLFGINCKHYPTPFIPGVSLIRGQPMSEEANKQAYEDSQKQRALERKIREEKRDLMMLKAQGAPDEVIKAQRAKIRQTDDDIDNFCAETGRARRQNREGVYTERKFPSADTYDVTQFERTQKDLIEQFYNDGGAQQGYTFGELVPNEPIAPVTPVSPVPQQTPAKPQYTIEGNIEKLRNTLSQDEYKEVVTMIENGETGKLYEMYGDKLSGVSRLKNAGRYTSWDTVEYDLDSKPRMNKYSTMAHEMGHMFDKKIGETPTLTFNEVNTINNKCTIGSGASKLLKVTPSTSDEFLSAMRKDKARLTEVLNNSDEIAKMKVGTWRNATAGVQDAMDGFFSTQDKNILPWGHGNAYYNRKWNITVKAFNFEDNVQEAYEELGFGLKNKTATKLQFRDYETASELWANVVSALTCGGEELEAFEMYMPETVSIARSIIGGL